MDKEQTLSQKRAEAGRKGGLKGGKKGGSKGGPAKNRMAHLTPEEKSKRMRELSLKAAAARTKQKEERNGR